MSQIVTSSITIHAPIAKVWDALINPKIIKQYLFGTHASSTWQVGSEITYTGEWQGKTYQDKGVVLQNIPMQLLETTYWSSMGGTEDKSENYKKITYTLSEQNGETKVTITQDNNKTEEEKHHSGENWNMVLQKMKEVVEKS